MKRLFFLFLLLLLCSFAYGQLLVLDAAANFLIEKFALQDAANAIEQAISFTQMVANDVQQIMHTIAIIEQMKLQVDMAAKNMVTAVDIRSWDDYMDWYNRQIYLEKRALSKFENTNVTFGGKSYHFTDIKGIRDGISDTYTQHWENDFTEEQRKAMWVELGLTPANYVYRETFRKKANDWADEHLFAKEIQNDSYISNMERNKDRQSKLAQDQHKSKETQLSDKEIQMMLLESSMENNKALNDIAMQNAALLEMYANESYLQQIPYDAPLYSEWSGNSFTKLSTNDY